jgi:hypothetical protein
MFSSFLVYRLWARSRSGEHYDGDSAYRLRRVSGLVFANLSFTAMRAQGKGRIFWKVLTFIFGFPGTLLTLFVVTEGGERAYGIDMPRKSGTQ